MMDLAGFYYCCNGGTDISKVNESILFGFRSLYPRQTVEYLAIFPSAAKPTED